MLALEEPRGAWTVAKLADLDVADRHRFQIVDGALVVSPPPAGIHELFSEDLRAKIREALPPGLAVVGPVGVAIDRSYLVPDLVVVRRDRVRSVDYLQPEDALLVVEIVSPSSVTMDRLVKPAQYASAGIPAFWRVETDPVGLTGYSLPTGSSTYVEVGTWSAVEVAELTEPFPVRIDLSELAHR